MELHIEVNIILRAKNMDLVFKPKEKSKFTRGPGEKGCDMAKVMKYSKVEIPT